MTEQVMAYVETLSNERGAGSLEFYANEHETVVVPETNVNVPEYLLVILNTAAAIELENDPIQLYLQCTKSD